MYDIIVIGAGPAGMTAAIYAKRASMNVLILEEINYGGQIANALHIENYPGERNISGIDLVTKIYEQLQELGVSVIFEKALDIRKYDSVKYQNIKTVVTANNSYEAKAVIIASGSVNRKLGLEEEERLTGRGISYCATCDGNFYKGKTVAVAGGGNTALEEAVYLSDLAEKVYLIHRRDSFRGEQLSVDELKEKNNVEFVLNTCITRLIAKERLNAIEVTHVVDGRKRIIELNGLFIAVGRMPENQNFAAVVRLDDYGYIIAGEDCHTSCDGIFAAGDNRTKKLRQLVTATADGAMAASEAIQYIRSL